MSKNTAVRVSILTIFLSASIFSCVLYAKSALFPICGAAVFILLNIFPSFIKRPSKKLRISSDGADLLTSFLALVCIECIAFPIRASLVIGWFTAPFLIDVAPQPPRHRYPRVLCRTCRRSERSRILSHMRILIHT